MDRKVYYRTEKELEGIHYVARITDFGLSLTIECALNELLNAYLMVRDMPIFRQKLKQYANQAENLAKLRRARILALMKDRNFYNVYSDRAIDLAEDDLTRLRIGVKQILDDAKNEHSDVIAQCEVARIMLHLACEQYSAIMQKAKEKFGCDYSKTFYEFNIKDVRDVWDKATSLIYKDCYDADLNTDKIQALFDTMAGKFADGMYIEECLKAAKEEHCDFTNQIKVTDEEKILNATRIS